MNPVLEMSSDNSKECIDLYDSTNTIGFENNDYIVYQDIVYKFKLKNTGLLINIEMFINDESIDIEVIKEGDDYVLNLSRKIPIFLLIYGVTEIVFVLTDINGNENFYFTPPLIVATQKKNEHLINSLCEMLDYIFEMDSALLYKSKIKNENLNYEYKKNSKINLEQEVIFINSILNNLQKNLPYFLSSSQMEAEQVYSIDNIEKAKNMDTIVLQYIVTHPDELKQAYNSEGILYNKNRLLPQKTMVKHSVYTYNTYENNIIMQFIWTLWVHVNKRETELNNLIKNNRLKFIPFENNDYVLCNQIIQKYITCTYSKIKENYSNLRNRILKVYTEYSRVLPQIKTCLNKPPMPTPIFLEVYHYRNVFQNINYWFGKSDIVIPKKNILLHFYSADKIYEYYCLLGIIEAFSRLGFTELIQKRDKYIYDNIYSKLHNDEFNTFYFVKDNIEITLFYQPMVYSKISKKTNNINLFRTDGRYYSPDFIIKKRTDNKEEYMILDAKWRNRKILTTRNIEGGLSDLVYKYIYSIVSNLTMKSVDYMWILQGKDDLKNYDTWTPRNGQISKMQNDKFKLGTGIVRYTPMSGSRGIEEVLNIFVK